jgi:adenine-specific DNA-methyltransferase
MTKLKLHTPDLTAANVERIAALFPNCVTEATDETGKLKRAIDFDLLKQELSADLVEGPQERYRLDWPGKREALALANKPVALTLRPCREESVDFENTKNLYIEGDNLDALKLLQETYLGKVKMIYIDPPYNTGNDFIYDDNFSMTKEEFAGISGDRDAEGNTMFDAEKWKQNSSSNGRFHSEWLSMVYPRLKLARNLLSDEGVIFISIDDNEVANLKKLCDEVFGEDNFVGSFKWNRVAKAPSLSESIRSKYELVLAYFKCDRFKFFGKQSYNTQGPLWHLPNKRNELLFPSRSIKVRESFKKGKYGGTYDVELLDDLIEENGLNQHEVRIMAHSAWGQSKINEYSKSGQTFEIKKSPTTVYTTLSSEDNYIAPSDLITKEECGVGTNTEASDALKKLDIPFDYPKPVSLITYLVNMVTRDDNSAIVFDFFSGSAVTAHAVMQLNAEDGGKRRHIMVQLPEPCDEKSEAFKAGYKTIAEIGKERIRRAGKKILAEWQAKHENPENLKLNTDHSAASAPDIGFRVLKIDDSNMKDVYYAPDEVKQSDLLGHADNLKEGRTNEDLLFQVLVDWGVDLALPITQESITGKTIFFVDGNALAACFDPQISEELVKELAKRKPMRAVFRDGSYCNDSSKINVEQIFKHLSPGTEVKSL